ncbi:MAG TPA: acyl-CoA dehydrogenase family protein, partial [Sphingomonadales bacterium]
MDFSLSEEQTLLRNSVERFIADRYEFTRRMKLAESPQGWSDENWALFAEQGWLAIPFAEEDGGLNFGLPEMMIMM